MASSIIGRTAELRILDRLLASGRPEFLAVYGRRRVGKTFLISEYFRDRGRLFEVVGGTDTSTEVQLARFAVELSSTFSDIPKDAVLADWDEAFHTLTASVDTALKAAPAEKIILFFDEAPWLDAGDSGFLSALAYAWNRHFSRTHYHNVLIVICGSAASWMIGNVINNKGGLYNRVTETLRLMPFDLAETKMFLESRNVGLPDMQIVEIYMALGGVPAYLDRVRPGKSSAQIINELCFTGGQFLADEFNRLFQSLFAKYHKHVKVVRALASAPKGLGRQQVLDRAGLSNGGDASLILKELTESGFVASMAMYGKKRRGRFYRLIDEYSLFYLKWIEPLTTNALGAVDANYWLAQHRQPGWYAWAGYAFEGICLKNAQRIKRALGIAGVSTTEWAWSFVPDTGSDERGAQIDLVIDRADRTINLCELKFVREEFEISSDYRRQLEHKKEAFRRHTGTKSLLLTTLLTPCGAKKGKNYLGAVDNDLTIDCLFASGG